MERKKSVSDTKPKVATVKLLQIDALHLSDKIRIGILVVLHLVGIVGYSLPEYRPLFQLVTPVHLVVISIVLLFEKSVLTKGFAIFFGLAFAIGYGAEVFGIKSGLIFGYYEYTDFLGFKLLDVPLVIGLLWASTAYASNQIAEKMFKGTILKVIIAALLMVLFDYLLEPFAVSAELWRWNLSVIPNYNYLSWFVVGLLLSIIYQNTVKSAFNRVSPYFLLIQVIFFLVYQLINGNVSFNPFD